MEKVVYIQMPVDRELKAEWHKRGYKVLPLDMMPDGFDNPFIGDAGSDKEAQPVKQTRKPKKA